MLGEVEKRLVREEFARLGGVAERLRVVDVTQADNPERLPPHKRVWELTLSRDDGQAFRAQIPGDMLRAEAVLSLKLRALLEAAKS